ncbi:MAG: M23 family metallopeptidase [Myxococcaceae bacterium]|nr:M23 family metallopeptidase [Myxococcaceae bacterium]MCI0669873.1 M23 family metallopeptidase [Myxococcaceae bacterium]
MRLLALLLLASSPAVPAPNPPPTGLAAARKGAEGPTLTVQPVRARPGDPVLVEVSGVTAPPIGALAGRPLAFFPVEGGFRAFGALPVETPAGAVEVAVTLPADEALRSTLEVEEPRWPARELRVAPEFTEPPPEVQQRIEEDRAAFAKAFDQPFSPPRFTRPFALPRKAGITARFGDRRTFNGQPQTQHYGLDLRGRPGDPIHAANDGVVVLVRECFASGNSVVLDHGAGLYTTYFHLTRFAVKEGQTVKRGELLGTVGRTGRVTGPHLHWSVKVGGLYVDPESLLRLDLR